MEPYDPAHILPLLCWLRMVSKYSWTEWDNMWYALDALNDLQDGALHE